MQEGGQMAEQVMGQPQQESVDPAVQQISDFISQAIAQGQNAAEVVMSLMQQQVDQQTIGQALMINGFEENDIMSLFEELNQSQQLEEQVGGEPFPSDKLNQTPEELTEDTRMHSDDMSEEETNEPGMSMGKSGIEIKPENEGKFTRWAEARGMSVQEAASKVMANTDEYPPAVVKMANFAKNAAGWKKEDGGESYQMGGVPQGKVGAVNNVSTNKNMHWQRAPLYINPMEFEYTNRDFSLGKAAAVAYGGYKEFLSGDDANKDGVKDGFFRDGSKKAGIRDATKGDYYNYKITQDANDPNKYIADNTDLYNASRNKGSLRTVDQYGKDIAANSRFNYNTDTHDYDFITSSRPIDKRIYDSASQKNAMAGKDYNYLSAMDPDTKAMIMGGKDDLTGVRMGIDEYGSGKSYLPGAKNPYEYNTYMGINKVGQNSMIPVGDNGQPIAAMTTSPAIPGIPGSMMGATPSNAAPNVPQKSFKDWYVTGDAVRNQGKSQEQLKSEYDAYLSQGFKYGGNIMQNGGGTPSDLMIPYSNEYLDDLENDYLKMYNDPNTIMDDGYDKFYHSLIDDLPQVPIKSKGWIINIPGSDSEEFIEDDGNTTAPKATKNRTVTRVEDYVEGYELNPNTNELSDLTKYIRQRVINKRDNRSVSNNKVYEQKAYGGDLDKAQMGPPNWLAGMVNQNNYFNPAQQQGMNDFFSNMGQTDYAQDTQAVADAQLQNKFPALGATPQEQQTQSMFTPQQGTPTLNQFTTSASTSAAFNQPKVERTNKFEGGMNRLADSPMVQGVGKVSNFLVQASGVVNDWFRDKSVNAAREANHNKLGADYQYAIAEDPFNKRGFWDTNTGTAGSEGDRTVGLYMSKYGGENNTVNVDSNLLAKLIAAGADIEIL